VPGTHTYATAIRRLGHGEHLRWQGGQSERRLFDTLVARPRSDPPSLDDIDDGLRRALRRLSATEGCANQLSGGVDSSLLQTYLPTGTPTVSGAIDSPSLNANAAMPNKQVECFALGTRSWLPRKMSTETCWST
jgi:asparagine synthetase B (glutamine-hydrolysing)